MKMLITQESIDKGYANKAKQKAAKVAAALQSPAPSTAVDVTKKYVPKVADPIPVGVNKQAVIDYAFKAIPILRKIEQDQAQSKGFNISTGIHTVFSGFNAVMSKQFKELDYLQVTGILENAGFCFKPVKRGFRVYLPEDAKNIQQHASDSKVNKLIDLIG